MKPLRSYRLLLHRLQNLLADVETDLHGERDHESVADFRPASRAAAPEKPHKPQLTDKDERDIQKKLKSIIDDLDPSSGLAYYNGDAGMDDETRDLIRASLETSLRTAKQLAKAKYTPKKYRDKK